MELGYTNYTKMKLLRFISFYFALFHFNQDVFAQLNMQLRSTITPQQLGSTCLSGIFGYADTQGKEYALVGTCDGMTIVNVSNPDNPQVLHIVNDVRSIWHEVSVWQHYAYVATEGGGGVNIIDLQYLPDSIVTHPFQYNDNGNILSRVHMLFIDEKGYLYLYGSNINRGVTIFDLRANPMQPTYVGKYIASNYVHDAYVRNDTMYTAEIYEGNFMVVDVSDRSNPRLVAQQATPNNFTHNTALSKNGNYLFTTDERSGSSLAAFDIRNLNDIKLVDTYRAEPIRHSLPHNTIQKGDFLITSWYKNGVMIHDVSDPEIMIKTGYYDTPPIAFDTLSSPFKGVWGVYPDFPSQTIVASDINQGLFVFTPTYKKGIRLKGGLNDIQNQPVQSIKIDLINKTTGEITHYNFDNRYKIGVLSEGDYQLIATKNGCAPKIFNFNNLKGGDIITKDISFNCNASFDVFPTLQYTEGGIVTYSLQSTPNEAFIQIINTEGKIIQQSSLTNRSGYFFIQSPLSAGLYFAQLIEKNKTTNTIKFVVIK